MDKLMEYICDELEDLEKKASKEGKLSMAEVEYLDKLTHIKKNILKSEMMTEEGGYSEDEGSYAQGRNYMIGGSYARGRGSNARRDSMGRYSSRGGSYAGGGNSNTGGSYARGGSSYANGSSYESGYSREDAKEELAMQLQELEQNAPDEQTKRMIGKWMRQLEQG